MKHIQTQHAIAAIVVLSVALLTACSRQAPTEPPSTAEQLEKAEKRNTPYTIVTTVSMVRDIAQQVAGDKAVVTGIIGTGVDPHLYKPTRNDVVALKNADVILYSGLMLEGKMGDILVKVAMSKPVFAVTELVPESYILEPPELEGHPDPHLWMDIAGWMKAVQAVQASLSKYDPDNSVTYAANAERYLKELSALHEYAKTCIASIPEKRRLLITAHDAFNYFGRAYGIEVKGIQGISTESSAGLEDIRQLVDLIVEREISAVFIESSVPDKNVRALIEGAKSRGRDVIIGGELFSDAMGPEGTYEGTYIGMLDHNVTLVARALGGEAPLAGYNGKLTLHASRH
ncbi:MAG: zinc ABC transporter substrate-binding protein [Verrucomicrobia bacterium]|nr:zinc ABC transporter substrate-binding protein [Verrucomicrobiota bacterium]